MSRQEFRRRWLINHKKYEKRGLAIFRKRFRESASKIPFESLNLNNYELLITLNILEQDVRQAYFDLHLETGIRNGKKIGRAINKEIRQQKAYHIKDFEPGPFENQYRQFLSQWLINNAGTRITSVKDELIEYLIKFIADGVESGKDIRTISRELQKHVLGRSFYRWQIERIVRTETTAAANLGAIQAGESSGIVWEKEWISSNDSRTRRRPQDEYDHLRLDGVRVPKDGFFEDVDARLQFPGDPSAPAGAVINCRCAVSVVPKRNADGEIVFTTSQGRTITF